MNFSVSNYRGELSITVTEIPERNQLEGEKLLLVMPGEVSIYADLTPLLLKSQSGGTPC